MWRLRAANTETNINPATSGERVAVYGGIGAVGIIAAVTYLVVHKSSTGRYMANRGNGLALKTEGKTGPNH